MARERHNEGSERESVEGKGCKIRIVRRKKLGREQTEMTNKEN